MDLKTYTLQQIEEIVTPEKFMEAFLKLHLYADSVMNAQGDEAYVELPSSLVKLVSASALSQTELLKEVIRRLKVKTAESN